MKPTITLGLQYICGGLFGVINNKNILATINDKEDFQRSIQYYLADGNNMRFNYIGLDTRGYSGQGGMNTKDNRTYEIILEACNTLINMFPEYTKLNLKKKNNKPEVKLTRIINKVINIDETH
jgi:hypothetical protein